jgi:hypothetical protein
MLLYIGDLLIEGNEDKMNPKNIIIAVVAVCCMTAPAYAVEITSDDGMRGPSFFSARPTVPDPCIFSPIGCPGHLDHRFERRPSTGDSLKDQVEELKARVDELEAQGKR